MKFQNLSDMMCHIADVEFSDIWQPVTDAKDLQLNYKKIDATDIEEYLLLNDYIGDKTKIQEQLLKGCLVLYSPNNSSVNRIVEIDGKKMVKTPGQYYIFMDMSPIISLFERIGMRGQTITSKCSVLSDPEVETSIKENVSIQLAEIYNFMKDYISGDPGLLILIREGLIAAIFSQKYEPEAQSGLIEDMNNTISSTIEGSQFLQGEFKIDHTTVDFKIGDLSQPHMTNFKEAYKSAGWGIPNDACLFVRLQTSDLGNLQISYTSFLSVNDKVFAISKPYKFKHYKKAKRSKQALESILTYAINDVDKIGELVETTIHNPIQATIYALKECGVIKTSKGLAEDILERIRGNYTGATTNALDLYSSIYDVAEYDRFKDFTLNKKSKILEQLHEVLKIDWKKADSSLADVL